MIAANPGRSITPELQGMTTHRLPPDRHEPSPLKTLHVAAGCVCALGLGIDLIEVSQGSALAVVFSAPPYSLNSTHLSWLLAAVYVGAVFGAQVAGRIADRIGIKRTLAATSLFLAVTSMLSAVFADPSWFGLFRMLSGLSLGAYPPLMVAYLTAIVPTIYRGLIIFWVCAVAYLAPPFGIFLVRWASHAQPLGIEGWRWPFLAAGAIAIGVCLSFARLPEPPQWLVQARQFARAERARRAFDRSRRLVLLDRWLATGKVGRGGSQRSENVIESMTRLRIASRLRFTVAVYFLHPWATTTFPLLTGPILLQRGHNLDDTLLYVAIATFGPALGTFASAFLVDRVTRHVSLSLMAGLMMLALGLFFASDDRALLAVSVVAYSLAVAIYTPLMTMYGAELFPIKERPLATGLAWSGNRLAALLVPIIVLPLLKDYGAQVVGVVAAVALVVSICVVTLFRPTGAAEFGFIGTHDC